MAGKGRSPGFIMSNEHRVKIQNSNILNALIEHVTEGREMLPTQVTAGIALMKKVLPDLASVTVANEPGETFKTEEVGSAGAKILAQLETIAERSGTPS